MYSVGDIVIKSSSNENGLRFIGKVVGITDLKTLREVLEPDIFAAYMIEFCKRDKDFELYPIYTVESLTSGRATFSEAKSIVPGMTNEQYDFLMSLSEMQLLYLYGQRNFFCLESDLMSCDDGVPS